ncbi:amidohydrolase [Trichoderma arundinaceum]|uniref:Amidohydrolase n=1 Tax=Trichoderma arundinaceum TaxID=490622 RepID=A0A395P1T4_TRIAR|nr:amidohydrolase [Trichoderma arundinaceum]
MLFSTIIASGLFVANSAFALAILPRELAQIESVANATAKGIDVFGPIPGDAVQADNGYWTAEEGTDAWAWIRAQIDIPSHARPQSEKRQNYANIGIGMFAQDWCTGQAGWWDDVTYDVQHYVTLNMFSVGISYRGLRSNEQLDFSRQSGNDWCGQYLYSAGQNTPIGCFNSQAINCYRLTLH